MARHVRRIDDFQPELRKPAVVLDCDPLAELLPLLEAVEWPLHRDLEVAGVLLGPVVCDRDADRDHVGEARRQPEAGGESRHQADKENDADDRQREMTPNQEVVGLLEHLDHVNSLARLAAPCACAGHRYSLEAADDDVGGADALYPRRWADNDAVTERVVGKLLYVVRDYEVAAVQQRA